jgi:hypothetical protein
MGLQEPAGDFADHSASKDSSQPYSAVQIAP